MREEDEGEIAERGGAVRPAGRAEGQANGRTGGKRAGGRTASRPLPSSKPLFSSSKPLFSRSKPSSKPTLSHFVFFFRIRQISARF